MILIPVFLTLFCTHAQSLEIAFLGDSHFESKMGKWIDAKIRSCKNTELHSYFVCAHNGKHAGSGYGSRYSVTLCGYSEYHGKKYHPDFTEFTLERTDSGDLRVAKTRFKTDSLLRKKAWSANGRYVRLHEIKKSVNPDVYILALGSNDLRIFSRQEIQKYWTRLLGAVPEGKKCILVGPPNMLMNGMYMSWSMSRFKTTYLVDRFYSTVSNIMKKFKMCAWIDSRKYTPRVEGGYSVEKGRKAGLDKMGVHWKNKEVLSTWQEGIAAGIIEKLDLKECR